MAIKVRKRGEGDESPEDDEEEADGTSTVAPTDSDPFMRGSMRTISWLADNQTFVFAALGIAILAGIGVYIGFRYMRQQSVAASHGVSHALRAYEVPVEGSPRLKAIKKSENAAAPSKTYASENKKWRDVYERAGKTLSEHSSQKVAQMARMTRASAAIRIDKPGKAVSLYKAYLDKSPSTASAPMAYYGLSVARAEQGNYEQAVAALDKMVEADQKYESFALYHKGLFMQEAGNVEKAKKFFNKVLETDPESPYKTDVERRLALL